MSDRIYKIVNKENSVLLLRARSIQEAIRKYERWARVSYKGLSKEDVDKFVVIEKLEVLYGEVI